MASSRIVSPSSAGLRTWSQTRDEWTSSIAALYCTALTRGQGGDRNCVEMVSVTQFNYCILIGSQFYMYKFTCAAHGAHGALTPNHFTHPSCSCASWGKASGDRYGDPSCSGCERCGSYSWPFCLETDLKVVESLFTVKRRWSVSTLFGWYI